MKAIDLHERFRWLPRVYSALVMRYTRLDWEACDQILMAINVLRDKEGLNRKKWDRIR